MANDNTKISDLVNSLAASALAAGDILPVVDISAEETKQLTAMSAALGLTKLLFFEDAGGDDAYVISTGLSLSSLTAGFAFALKVTTGNTGACTLTVDGVDAKSIKVVDGSGVRDPLTGEIAAGMTALVSYNGTYFILLNPISVQEANPLVSYDFYIESLLSGQNNIPLSNTLFNSLVLRQDFTAWRASGTIDDGQTVFDTGKQTKAMAQNSEVAVLANMGSDSTISFVYNAVAQSTLILNAIGTDYTNAPCLVKIELWG